MGRATKGLFDAGCAVRAAVIFVVPSTKPTYIETDVSEVSILHFVRDEHHSTR